MPETFMGRLACQAALQVTTLRILPSTIALADLLEDCSFHYSAYIFSCIVKCCMLPSTLLGCAGLAAFASQPLHAMHASCLDNFRCCTEGEVVGGEVGVQILAGRGLHNMHNLRTEAHRHGHTHMALSLSASAIFGLHASCTGYNSGRSNSSGPVEF